MNQGVSQRGRARAERSLGSDNKLSIRACSTMTEERLQDYVLYIQEKG